MLRKCFLLYFYHMLEASPRNYVDKSPLDGLYTFIGHTGKGNTCAMAPCVLVRRQLEAILFYPVGFRNRPQAVRRKLQRPCFAKRSLSHPQLSLSPSTGVLQTKSKLGIHVVKYIYWSEKMHYPL